MEIKEINFNKKRDAGTIISDSFIFLRQEFKPLSKLILVYVLPFVILYGLFQVFFLMKMPGNIDLSDKEKLLENIGPFYLRLLLSSIFGIFIQAIYIGTFYTYVEAYIKSGRGNFSVNDLSHQLFSNTLLVLGTSLLMLIIFIFGFFICIIPGIYFANSLSISLFIVIRERKGIGNALSRSFELVRYKWWDTFLLNLAGFLIIAGFSIILSIPSMIAGISVSFFPSREASTIEIPLWFWILTGVNTVISTLLSVILPTFYIFQYYSILKYTQQNLPSDS